MKYNRIILTLILFTITVNMSCTHSSKREVDLIIKNGVIYTVDSLFTIHESMAIDNGKVVALGKGAEIERKFKSAKSIDLQGKPIYPGFIDPHAHFLGYGLGLNYAWLADTESWQETVDKLIAHQDQNPSHWVLGRGWNQNQWDVKEFPTLELLDKAFPEKPVLLTRIDGHAAIANSIALGLAGITNSTTIAGGEVILDKGKPTGVLIDNAITLVRDLVPQPGISEKEDALLKAQELCFAVGLTSVSDAGTDKADVLLMDSLQKNNLLSIGINIMLNPTQENYDYFLTKGVYTTPKLSVRTIKLFSDGALGSRGALLLEAYSDAPQTSGLQLDSEESLKSVCQRAYKAGFQVATHCIGDAAVRLMLNVYEDFLPPGNDLRWRIEHAQIVHPNDIHRFGQLAVIPSVQTTHATSDMLWAKDRLGNRIETAYAYADLLKQNGWLPNGSDFPIEDINPIFGFYAGVVRKNFDGYPPHGFQMKNALTREQALRSMTIWAAKAAFEEEIKGSLEVGKTADFVVLNQDIMNVAESEILKTNVIKTFVDGKVVYLSNLK